MNLPFENLQVGIGKYFQILVDGIPVKRMQDVIDLVSNLPCIKDDFFDLSPLVKKMDPRDVDQAR